MKINETVDKWDVIFSDIKTGLITGAGLGVPITLISHGEEFNNVAAQSVNRTSILIGGLGFIACNLSAGHDHNFRPLAVAVLSGASIIRCLWNC